MSDVPEEILLEILSRLPVVPLLRFRCVSKPWKRLIDGDEFTRLHLKHSLKNTNSNLNIILETHHHIYSVDFDLLKETNNRANTNTFLFDAKIKYHFQQLIHPLWTPPGGGTLILGSCHGLLALLKIRRLHKTTSTILWNPSVRRFHELPYEESLEYREFYYISHGFGYDAGSDDYKLVRMVQLLGDAGIQVKVYSLKSDSWRRIPDLPYNLTNGLLPGVLANGALHWIVRSTVKSDHRNLAIAFDLGTDEFNLVPLPEFAVNNHTIHTIFMFVLGGCIGFIINYFLNGKAKASFWVMKEYRVEDSWSLLFTCDLHDCVHFMWPIAYSKCSRNLLIGLDAKVLVWYDLDKKSPVVHIPIDESYGSGGRYHTCLQSLVMLSNGTCDFDLITNTTKRQERKAENMSSTRQSSHVIGSWSYLKICITILTMLFLCLYQFQGRRNSWSLPWTRLGEGQPQDL